MYPCGVCPACGLQRCVNTQWTPPILLHTSMLTAQGSHSQVFVAKGKKGVGREEGQGGAPEARGSSRHRPAPNDSAGKEQNNLGTLTAPAGMDEPLEARQEVDTSGPAQPRGKGEYGGQRRVPGLPVSSGETGRELPGEVTWRAGRCGAGGWLTPAPTFFGGTRALRWGGQKIRGTGEPGAKEPRGQGWWAHVWRQEDRHCRRPRLAAKRTEPSSQHTRRSVISVCSPLSTCCLRPSARRFGAQRSLDPLQRQVN